MFGSLDSEQTRIVLDAMYPKVYAAGDTIIRQVCVCVRAPRLAAPRSPLLPASPG